MFTKCQSRFPLRNAGIHALTELRSSFLITARATKDGTIVQKRELWAIFSYSPVETSKKAMGLERFSPQDLLQAHLFLRLKSMQTLAQLAFRTSIGLS